MATLLLEHKPLNHMCARCYDDAYLTYETKVCPRCGCRFTEPKVVVPASLETVLVGKMGFAAYEDVVAAEDARVVELLTQFGGTA